MSGSWSAQEFPNLGDGDYIKTSPVTRRYNCIAWSVGDTIKKWWPDQWGIGSWFPNIPRLETLDAFTQGYESYGYVVCPDGVYEAGFEKVALYAKPGSAGTAVPTHAAFQLENGRWTSKLGDFEDIEHHSLDKLNSAGYGSVIRYFKRPRQPRPHPPDH